MTTYEEQLLLDYLGCNPDSNASYATRRLFIDGMDGPITSAAREKFKMGYQVSYTEANLLEAVAGHLKWHEPVVQSGSAMSEKDIWDALRAAGFTEAGTAGLMGNLRNESNLCSTNLEDQYERKLGFTNDTYTAAVDNGTYSGFVTDCAGYGLAQWTYWSRKKELLEFAKANHSSIGDCGMQVQFLVKELRERFTAVYNLLRHTNDIRDASDTVMLKFECPADTSANARAVRASSAYVIYNKYKSGGNA